MPLKLYPPGKRGPYYYVVGTLEGVRIEVSTKTKDKAAGERFKAKYEWDFLNGRVAPPDEKTFAYAAIKYQEAKDHLSKQELKYIKDVVREIGHISIRALQVADIHAAANKIKPSCKASTRNRHVIRPAAAILHYAAENKWCDHMRIKLFKEAEPERTIPAKEIVGLYIRHAKGKKKAFLVWLAYAGKRVSESLDLRGERVDLKKEEAYLYISKSQHWHRIPLDKPVVKAFKATWPDGMPEGRIFPWGDRHNVYRWLREMASEHHLPHMRPHMLRHAVGSLLHASGADIVTIQNKLGQKDMRSTRIYIKGDMKVIRDESKKALDYHKHMGRIVGKRKKAA